MGALDCPRCRETPGEPISGSQDSGRQCQARRTVKARTHDQNFATLMICNKIVTLLKINVPSCQINDPPSQINDPPSQIIVPHCQINVPWSNNCRKFLRQNRDLRDIYLQEGHIFVSHFDHVYGPLRVCTHDQNFVPLNICYKIVTLLKINVPSCQINDPHGQINVPLSNKFPNCLRQNHDPRDIYL